MNMWAIVPVKPLGRAKSRLAEALGPEQRERLASGLLERTIRLLTLIPHIQGVLVVSRDTKALAMVRSWGAQTVQESGTPELNHALLRATQALKLWGATAVLVIPADLPLLTTEDVEEVVEKGRLHHSVVLVPNRHEEGTNMLLVRPPGLIPYAFGADSFARHQRLARETGAIVYVHRSERVALDLDTPDDLLLYYELAKTLGEPIIEHSRWLAEEPSLSP